MRSALAKAAAVVLAFCGTASGHDLYLVSGVADAEGKVCARIGERFPESSSSVTADRLELFRLRTADGVTELNGEKSGDQFCAPLSTPAPAIAEMVVHPRFIKLSASDFDSYIEGERFEEVIRLRRAREKSGSEGRELYSRYAKLLLGELGESASHPLGHILEIVPEKDPAALTAGQPLTVRVLFRGKPLAGARVAAVYAGAEMKGHDFPVLAQADKRGRAVLKLDRSGLWYARLIHMTGAQGDPEVDWRSYFATLAFTIPQTPAPR